MLMIELEMLSMSKHRKTARTTVRIARPNEDERVSKRGKRPKPEDDQEICLYKRSTMGSTGGEPPYIYTGDG